MKRLTRLRAEWTKNDGKPIEEWAPGSDLKDTLLRIAAITFCVLQIGLLIWMWWWA